MTYYLDVVTKKGNIKIQLLDNNFIPEFVSQVKRNRDLFQVSSWNERIPYSRQTVWNDTIIKQREQELRSAVIALNSMGLNFPIAVDNINLTNDSNGRDLLNRLHRHFTTSHRSYSHNESVLIWQDGTDWTFTVRPEDRENFVREVHNINTAVHMTEGYYVNDRIRTFKPRSEFQVVFNSSKPRDPTNNIQQDYFLNIKPEHYQYFSDKLEHNVWLPIHQIQGKNYWVAYFDEDDPRHWDVSTNIQYTGSFSIGDRSAIRDPAILDYLRSYGIEPGPLHCGMPIGDVVEGLDIVAKLIGNDVLDVIINE